MTGKIAFVEWITRDMVRANPDAIFVFGDNTERVGLGGQAGAMRGEPNAIGVATKWRPGMRDADFFTDEMPGARAKVDVDIDRVAEALMEGRTVNVPRDGLGTGLSQLPTRAPKLHQHIVDRFRALAADCPW